MNLYKTFGALLVAASVYSCTAGAPAFSQDLTREQTYAAVASAMAEIATTLAQPQSLESVVVVHTAGGSKGTATHLGNGRFLTAAHVINGSENGTLTDWRGAKVPYVVVINHASSDVAVIQAQEPITLPSRTIDCRYPRIGEEVEVVGHPLQWSFVYSWGRVATGPTTVTGFGSGVFIAMPVAQGHSGSAVLDRDGRIIGIVNAGMVDSGGNAGFTFSVSGRTICGVLTIS